MPGYSDAPDVASVIRSIMTLSYSDDDLKRISDACHEAHKTLRKASAAETLANVKVGDTVRIGEGVSPKYLRGEKATVKAVRGTKLVIRINGQPEFGRFGGDVRIPAELVTKVDA